MNNTPYDLNATKHLLSGSNFYYIICTDNIGNYSYINDHYASRFSHIDTNLVGKPYYITMHPDDTKVCEEVGGKCYEQPGKLFPATIRKHDGAGGYIITQWEFTLIIENGEPQGVFCLGYDITEFAAAKEKAEVINKDLETKNELLGEIAFEQSHIVRAPLASIMGLIAILKDLKVNDEAVEIIKLLEESCLKLDDVIKSIVKRTNV